MIEGRLRSIDRRQLLVVAVALMCLTAMPGSAAAASSNEELVVGSQYDTKSEFSNSQSLDNLTATDTGDGAVELANTAKVVDSYEDGDISEYSGDTGPYSVNSTFGVDGSNSLEFSSSDSSTYEIVSTSGLAAYPSAGETFRAHMKGDGNANIRLLFGVQDANNAYWANLDIDSNTLRIYKESSGSVNLLDSTSVTLNGSTEYILEVDWTSSGFTVAVLDASGNQLASLSSSDTTYQSGGVGTSVTTPDSAGTSANIDYIHIPGGGSPSNATYLSPIHNVSGPQEAAINITQLTNVSVTATVQTDGGTTLNQTTITSTGNHSLILSSTSKDKIETKLELNITGTNPAFTLADESILFTNHHPAVDNSSASPSGGTTVSDNTVTLSIDASDADFGTAQGESVDVTFYDASDDSVIGTDTLASNGTASTTWEISKGGNKSWYAVAKDDYGGTTTSDTFTFKTPSELVFRNEKNTSEVLDDINVSVTAYYGDETIRRNTSNGRISLEGFPIDQPIIIRATSENYTTRTAVIESVFDQSNIYLLKKDVATYQVRFDLQDATGEYPRDETVLFVERDLELNGTVEWRIISGDNFGVQGVPVTLEQDERYRLRVKNLETGATATIGAFTPVQNESVTISPGSATIDIVDSESEYGWSVTENESDRSILFEYYDKVNETDSVTLTIHERFNKSNVLLDNETFTNANNIVYEIPMTANQTNQTWMAEIYVERNGNVTHFREPITSGASNILPANLGEHWASGVGVFIMLITGMAFSELNKSAGAVATALAGGMLWQLGFLSTVTTAPAIILTIGISVLYHYRTGGDPT